MANEAAAMSMSFDTLEPGLAKQRETINGRNCFNVFIERGSESGRVAGGEALREPLLTTLGLD